MAKPNTHRNDGTQHGGRIALAVLAALLLAPAGAFAAGEPGSGGKGSKAVAFESIPGSKIKRIILTEKAAQRLGIETGKVDQATIVRKQVVGGIFIAPPSAPPKAAVAVALQPGVMPASSGEASGSTAATFAYQRSAQTPPPIGEPLVRVMFSPQEWEKLAKDQPVRLFKLGPRAGHGDGVTAKPSGLPPMEDLKRSMMTYFYVVEGEDHGFQPNERVRVELQLADSGEKRKVVPYSAVYYDAKGGAWAYLNPKPLVYERTPLRIEYVLGDKAALVEGPEVGTVVVTVGAAMLYGAEVYGK